MHACAHRQCYSAGLAALSKYGLNFYANNILKGYIAIHKKEMLNELIILRSLVRKICFYLARLLQLVHLHVVYMHNGC